MSPSPDLRMCLTMRWGNGVDLVVKTDQLRPISIARDGADGAFVLTGEVNAQNSEIELLLHHISAAGVKTATTSISSGLGVWFYSAYVIPSAIGTCIVIWTSAGWGAGLSAQKFDTNGSALWPAAMVLNPTNHGFANVGAASDGHEGALVAFTENFSDVAASQHFRVQRVNSDGNLPWGASGTLVNGVPDSTPQIVVGPNEFAVLWHEFFQTSGPISVHAAWVSLAGQLIGTPATIGSTFEIWLGQAKRHAIADPSGGFYVAFYPISGPLQLARFESRSMTSAWSIPTRSLALAASYSLAEDGSGGALLASVDPTGLVCVGRYDRKGTNMWASATAANVSTITLGLPTGTPVPALWGGVVAIAAKKSGGAIAVIPDWGSSPTARLHSRCFDSSGAFVGTDSLVTAAAGGQAFPLLADMVLPVSNLPVPKPRPPRQPVPPDQESVICVWQGDNGGSGTTISAQKLGCCLRTYSLVQAPPREVVPEFPCSFPANWPSRFPGTIFVAFPCGDSAGHFGLLKIPDLATVPGLKLPGGLATFNVPVPRWVRVWFDRAPRGLNIELQSHKAVSIAKATPVNVSSAVEHFYGRSLTLTFQPEQGLSYVFVFRRGDELGKADIVPLGIRMEFGENDVPPLRAADDSPAPPAEKKRMRSGARKK